MRRKSLLVGICAVLFISCVIVTLVWANRTFSTEFTAKISSDRAKQIALQDAGEDMESVTFTRSTLSEEKDRLIYRVEFYSKEMSYQYKIDGNTGSVYHREAQVKERMRVSESEQTQENALHFIGVNRVQEIVLKDAGLDENDVQFEKVVLEHEDAVITYDVHFRNRSAEYEYKIDAMDGTVLEKEIEAPSEDSWIFDGPLKGLFSRSDDDDDKEDDD